MNVWVPFWCECCWQTLTLYVGESRVIPGFFNELPSSDVVDMDSVEFAPDKISLFKQMSSSDAQNASLPTTHAESDDPANPTSTDDDGSEKPYGIHIGTQFNNQYDPVTWVAGYPHLFPYGKGAPGSIEGVSLITFFRRSMQLVDD